MKYSIYLLAALLHIVCNADYITFPSSEQSWNVITSDNSAKIDYQSTNSTRTVYVANPITFSTQHKSFCYHTAVPQYDLNHMSTDQLAWYFSSQGYTEGEILSHPMLYMNQAYLTLAKQLPRYPEYVKMYYEKYRTYKGFFKFWETIHFRYRKGMRKKFARLHWECEEYRKAQGARHNAAQQTNISTIESHGIVNANTIRFAREYGITEQQLALMHNDTYAQQLHREFLDQLNEAQTISAYYALQPKNILIDAVGHGVAIGMEAHSLCQHNTANSWARFGREILEIIEGIGEGIVLFAENNAHMIRHPIYTLKQVVHCLGQVTGICARTIGTVAHWHELMESGNGLLMAQEMDDVTNQIVACGTLCAEKLATMPTRDIAKHATAIAADVLLTHRMFTLCGNLCAQAAPIVRDTITSINNRLPHINDALARAYEAARTESPVLQTAEGIFMKASEEMAKVDGAAVEILNSTRIALEAVHAEYMARLEVELQTLRLLCDNKVKGFAEFANKFLKLKYEHILGIESLVWNQKGALGIIDGFHHDLMDVIKKSGIFEFANQTMYGHGFYKATLLYEGNIVKYKGTFFPADWSREKVIDKIYEAYNSFIKSGVPPREEKGKYLIEGLISEGVKIRMYITKNGVLKTAYPILE